MINLIDQLISLVKLLKFKQVLFTSLSFIINKLKILCQTFDRSRSNCQKQPSKGVLMKGCSNNMQQIYRRTPMPKCDFNKVENNFIEIALGHGCSFVNLLHIFRTHLDGYFWTVKEITGKLMEKVKTRNNKAQVKKSATLLKIYCFSSTFQRILLGLKQILLLFIEAGFINTILSKIHFYIQ